MELRRLTHGVQLACARCSCSSESSKLPAAVKRWNLASLAAFLLNTNARLTIKTSPTGASVYGDAATR